MTAVLLAGTLAPSPLREAVGMLPLCLPMGWEGTLLDAWLRAIDALDECAQVRVSVNSMDDVQAATSILPPHPRTPRGRPVHDVQEPASWGGAGGILFDTTSDLPPSEVVLAIEAHAFPLACIVPLIQSLMPEDAGVVAVAGENEPAGLYAFRQSALRTSPPVGYFDMKEQLIPKLAANGQRLRAVHVGSRCIRIRDRRSYLAAVRASLDQSDGRRAAEQGAYAASRISKLASVSGSAVVAGCCVIEEGVVVEDGAVVHDSVLLCGSTIGGGAILSRSIVGPLTRVEPRAKLIRDVVGHDSVGSPGVSGAYRAT